MMAMRAVRMAAVLVCLLVVFAGAGSVGHADEVGITGTVQPQTLEVTISPQVIDLSHLAGESVERTIEIKNVGTLTAVVTLESVEFSGLTPVDPQQFDSKNPDHANECVLRLFLVHTGGGEAYLVGSELTAHLAIALYGSPINESAPLYVKLSSNRRCPGAQLGGRIVFDIQAAP
ncbi:MAG: hypothetical protein AB1816_14000 [Bacillota bacterium]